jgi:hypothetical protein
LATGSSWPILHMSELVFARLFSFGFLLAKIAGCFTSPSLFGGPRFFLPASTTKKTALLIGSGSLRSPPGPHTIQPSSLAFVLATFHAFARNSADVIGMRGSFV